MRASPVKRAFRASRLDRSAGDRRSPWPFQSPFCSAALWFSGVARANNGIPGSLGVLLPLDKPQEIGLATTFGLILSDDGGAELGLDVRAARHVDGQRLHRRSAAGRSLLRALAGDGAFVFRRRIVRLAGRRRGARRPEGLRLLHRPLRSDARPGVGVASPPTVVARRSRPSTPRRTAARRSTQSRSTPRRPALRSSASRSRGSDPQVVYLTYVTATSSGYHPVLVRSSDGGQSWTETDLLAPLGAAIVRILAVDSADSDLLYLRVIGATSETLAVTRDGGMTFATPLTIANGALSAFARLASGTVLVGALVNLAGRRGRHDGRRLPIDRRRADVFALDAEPPAASGRSRRARRSPGSRRSTFRARTTATAGRWPPRRMKG